MSDSDEGIKFRQLIERLLEEIEKTSKRTRRLGSVGSLLRAFQKLSDGVKRLHELGSFANSTELEVNLRDPLKEIINSLEEFPGYNGHDCQELHAFISGIKIWSWVLSQIKGSEIQTITPDVEASYYDCLDLVIAWFSEFSTTGVDDIKADQGREFDLLLNNSTVAIFLSSVTATLIQLSSQSPPVTVSSTLWLISLLLSTASAMTSVLSLAWRRTSFSKRYMRYIPRWISDTIRLGTIVLIFLSLVTFLGGFLIFVDVTQHKLFWIFAGISITFGVLVVAAGLWWLWERSTVHTQLSQVTDGRLLSWNTGNTIYHRLPFLNSTRQGKPPDPESAENHQGAGSFNSWKEVKQYPIFGIKPRLQACQIHHIQFSPSGTRLAICVKDSCQVYDTCVENGSDYSLDHPAVLSAEWNRDGTQIITRSCNQYRVWAQIPNGPFEKKSQKVIDGIRHVTWYDGTKVLILTESSIIEQMVDGKYERKYGLDDIGFQFCGSQVISFHMDQICVADGTGLLIVSQLNRERKVLNSHILCQLQIQIVAFLENSKSDSDLDMLHHSREISQ